MSGRRPEITAGLWYLSISDFIGSLDLSDLSRSCVGYGFCHERPGADMPMTVSRPIRRRHLAPPSGLGCSNPTRLEPEFQIHTTKVYWVILAFQ